jgi:hypothetical protein
MFVLILVALGSTPGVGGSVNQVGPLIIGNFSSMDACQAAASGARLVKAGTLPQTGHSGIEFVCVQGG